MANRSPPTPHDIGSIRPTAALAAIAASTALPPDLSTSRPTWAASGWLVATMPCGASTTDRPTRPAAGGCRSASTIADPMKTAATTAANRIRRLAIAPPSPTTPLPRGERGGRRSIVADRAVGVPGGRPLELALRVGGHLRHHRLVHLDAQPRRVRQERVAVLVRLPTAPRHARGHDVAVEVAFVDQKQRD